METSSLVIEVSAELEQRLRDRAAQSGMPLTDYLKTALEGLVTNAPARPSAEPSSPLIALFEPIWDAVPDEEWERLPTDLAEQHDHYLYGTRKRAE